MKKEMWWLLIVLLFSVEVIAVEPRIYLDFGAQPIILNQPFDINLLMEVNVPTGVSGVRIINLDMLRPNGITFNDFSVGSQFSGASYPSPISGQISTNPFYFSYSRLSGVFTPATYTLGTFRAVATSYGEKVFSFNSAEVKERASTTDLVTVDPYDLRFTVLPSNPPVANPPATIITNEDTSATITIGCFDSEGQDLTYSVISPSHGTLSIATDTPITYTLTQNSFTYTPSLDYNGPDSFTYKCNDGGQDSNTATVSITINPVNDAPVAETQTVTTPEDNSIDFILGSTDVDGDSLIYTKTDPAHGTLSINQNTGQATYSPNTHYFGSDSFTFIVNDRPDDTGETATATVSITITPINDAPFANVQSVTTEEDTAKIITLVGDDEETSTESLTYIITLLPLQGTLTTNSGVVITTVPTNIIGNQITYTPSENYNGPDSFKFRVNDGGQDSDPATVSITVNPVNDVPTFTLTNPQQVYEKDNFDYQIVASDVDSSSFTYTTSIGIIDISGRLTFTPTNDDVTRDDVNNNVNIMVCDDSRTATSCTNNQFTLRVINVNDDPIAFDDSLSTSEDAPLNFDVLGNDVDIDRIHNNNDLDISNDEVLYVVSFSNLNLPESSGTLSLSGNTFTYTPALDYNGDFIFTYIVSDGQIRDEATVTITVNEATDAPTANDDDVLTDEETSVNIPVLSNDNDVDGTTDINPASVSIITGPAHGTTSINMVTGVVTYTPSLDFYGTDTFTYTVKDFTSPTPLQSNSATVTITVNAINDRPIAIAQSIYVEEDSNNNPITLTGSDVDAGTTLFFNILATTINGETLSDAAPNLFYTPTADFTGTDSFTFTVYDGNVNSATATVSITIGPTNDAPIFTLTPVTTATQDIAYTYTATATDADIDDTLTYSATTIPGWLSFNPTTHVLSGTPTNANVGAHDVTLTVSDNNGGMATQSFTINVANTNDAPIWGTVETLETQEYSEDSGSHIYDLDETATDVDVGDTLTYTISSENIAEVDCEISGTSLTMTSVNNFNGETSCTLQVSDGTLTAQNGILISVTPVNDAPVAVDDSRITNEDNFINIDVLSNDNDVDAGDVLTITSVDVSQGTIGTVTFTINSVTYTPLMNYVGTDTFTYTISDGHGGTDVATVTITVTSESDLPIATADTFSTDEDTSLTITAAELLTNDADGDGDILGVLSCNPQEDDTTTSTDESTTGSILPTIDSTTSLVTSVVYTPSSNFNGQDIFICTIKDDATTDDATTDEATVTINVDSVNDLPTANGQIVSTNEDIAKEITLTGSDVENPATLNYAVTVNPTQGSLSGFNSATGVVTYTPNANYNGQDSFTFTVSDGTDTSSAIVSITITPVNDEPTANAQIVSTNEDIAKEITLTGSDVENPATLNYVVTVYPTQGILSGTGANIIYTPSENYNGPDSFKFKVNDGTADSAEATVSITVTPQNDLPIATDKSYSLDEDTTLSSSLGLSTTDIDGDSLTTELVTDTLTHLGIFNLNPDGSFTYTPTQNLNGVDTFTYRLSDGQGGLSDVKTATITVYAVNDAPTSASFSVTTNEDVSIIPFASTSFTFNDIDNDIRNHITIVSLPASGTLLYTDNNPVAENAQITDLNSIKFAPTPNYDGNTFFNFKVNDGTEDSATYIATINVNPVNDDPEAVNDNLNSLEDNPITIPVLDNDDDIDVGDKATLSVSSFTNPTSGTVTRDNINNNLLVYNPPSNWHGTTSFTYTISDTSGATDTATVTITVTEQTDVPIANNDPTEGTLTTNEDTLLIIDVLSNDVDDEGVDNLNVQSYGVVDANGISRSNNDGIITINNNILTYIPPLNFNSADDTLDSFQYTIIDGDENTATATVSIYVTSIGDAAIWQTLESKTIDEDSPTGTTVYAELKNLCTDVDSSLNFGVTSISNYELDFSNDDSGNLILTNLEENYYDSGNGVTVSCNGVEQSFTLTILVDYDDDDDGFCDPGQPDSSCTDVDNCPSIPNTDQENSDSPNDLIGDACDTCTDKDQDGYGRPNPNPTLYECSNSPAESSTCDANTDINPGEEEICDGIDNNCDGSIDNSDACSCIVGATRDCGINQGTCTTGQQTCTASGWDTCTGITPTPELCLDKLDNDCDGQSDCDDVDSCKTTDPFCKLLSQLTIDPNTSRAKVQFLSVFTKALGDYFAGGGN